MTRGRIKRRFAQDAVRSRGPARGERSAVPDGRTRLRVGHTEDLLALVPYLLGYHPREAIVAVLVRDDQVHASMRVDLPMTDAYAEAGQDLAGYMQSIGVREHVDGLALIGYSANRLALDRVLVAMMDAITELNLIDVYSVDGQRWWSLTCNGPCCPFEGVPYDLDSNPMAAAAVFAGLTAADRREDLDLWVRGPEADQVARLEAEARRLAAAGTPDRTTTVTDILALVAAADQPEPDEAASLRWATALRDLITRDMVWASIRREDAERHSWLWHRVVAQVPPSLSAAPLGLMALAFWIAGSGSLLNICGDRLRALHPNYSLGGLLLSMSDNGIPPSAWDDLAAEMRKEFGLTDYLEEVAG